MMSVFPQQCEEIKKKRPCIAFLNYSFNFIEEEMQYDVEKKNKQNFYYRQAYFSEKEEQPILTETCLIKKFCGKICQCSRSPDSAGTCRNLRRSILIM